MDEKKPGTTPHATGKAKARMRKNAGSSGTTSTPTPPATLTERRKRGPSKSDPTAKAEALLIEFRNTLPDNKLYFTAEGWKNQIRYCRRLVEDLDSRALADGVKEDEEQVCSLKMQKKKI